MTVRLVGSATLVDGSCRRARAAGARRPDHPLAAVEGPFNAVMLQGDAIREITLEGPGAGGIETASAVVADMIIDHRHDRHGLPAERRVLARLEWLPRGDSALRSTSGSRSRTARRPRARRAAPRRARRFDSAARRSTSGDGRRDAARRDARGARRARSGRAAEIDGLPESAVAAAALPVISSRGVTGTGWT